MSSIPPINLMDQSNLQDLCIYIWIYSPPSTLSCPGCYIAPATGHNNGSGCNTPPFFHPTAGPAGELAVADCAD